MLDRYGDLGRSFGSFCLLQPTSPLRDSNDIKSAYQIFLDRRAFSVVSITKLEHPIAWCGTLGDNNSLDGFMKQTGYKQRQAQENFYRPNGAIYIAEISEFLRDQFLYRAGSYAYIMPKERSVDIDTELDFKFAEFLMSEGREET